MILSPKRWIALFFVILLMLAVVFSLVAGTQDPFIQYGYDVRKRFWGNSMYLNPGIAKNYDYDTVIIGSSMAQNFDMEFFRSEMSSKPVKMVMPGISVNEMTLFYDLAIHANRAHSLFLVVDLPQFNREYIFGAFPDRLPRYLYNDCFRDDFKYLWGYDTWFRFIPVNLSINFLYKLGIKFPSKLEDRLNIDKIGDWSKEYVFSKETVIENYQAGHFSTTRENGDDMENRMKRNIDTFLDHIFATMEGRTIVFAFPPYSVLYWYDVRKDGLFDAYMAAKAFFIERCQNAGVRVVDAQDMSEIVELNHYKDNTHYDLFIQAKLAEAMITGEMDVGINSFETKRKKLAGLILSFTMANADWLPK